MCGFAGFLGGDNSKPVAMKLLQSMTDTIIHRGPDDGGEWFDEEKQIGLGHRRLSIVDLSIAGHQPMASYSGRFIIAFNGEIYNHLELRELLNNKIDNQWNGHSDTETLLAGFEVWGIEETIKKSIGMFAFSVWDKSKQTLILGRDRLGEKPLYYGWQNGILLFGSELKALRSHPDFENEINRDALTLYLRHFYIPAPYSIYKNIYKLLPGQLLEVNPLNKNMNFIEYWSFNEVVNDKGERQFKGDAEQAVLGLESVLKASIKQQMIADVPLGAFLSGGVDSSTVVALMQSLSDKPVRTFSIGFNEDGYNEAIHAKDVAEHLGTDHTELYVTPEEAMDVIYKLPQLYDEPFADSSQIPTYLVSKMAKEYVTVSLSGDAGDELYCGYSRYTLSQELWKKLSKIPHPIRLLSANFIKLMPIKFWNVLNGFLPPRFKKDNLGDKLYKAARLIETKEFEDLYRGMISVWEDPEEIVIDAKEQLNVTKDKLQKTNIDNVIEEMMGIDTLSYLPDDILAKVDRSGMGVSLESRIPFLNHKVVEFAWTLPLKYKMHLGVTKWCLKEVLYRYVPKPLIDRPKMGFGVPIGTWLRGPLKEWAEALIDGNRLREEGFFNPEQIRIKWEEHQSGKRNWQHQLWTILMFQMWYEEYHK
jgi:asparagine synthase (glutamine-hydrolysing)